MWFKNINLPLSCGYEESCTWNKYHISGLWSAHHQWCIEKNLNYPFTYPFMFPTLPSLFALNPLDLISCHLSWFTSLSTGNPRLPGHPHLRYLNSIRFCVSPILSPPVIWPKLLKPVHCALWNSWSNTSKISCHQLHLVALTDLVFLQHNFPSFLLMRWWFFLP